MRPLATTSSRSAPLEPSASLFSVGSPLIRNFEPRGVWRRQTRPRCCALRPRRTAAPILRAAGFQQFAHREDHRRDDALGVASAAAPDVLVIFARREERRHGVHVRGERDRWIAPRRRDTLERRGSTGISSACPPCCAASSDRCAKSTLAHALFVLGDGLDVHQRAREFETFIPFQSANERDGGRKDTRTGLRASR